MLAQRGQLTMSPEVIHLEVGMARPFVAHIRKDPATNQRFVSEVIEVGPVGDSGRPDATRIFAPRPDDGRAVPAYAPSRDLLERLERHGFDRAQLDTGDADPLPLHGFSDGGAR